MSLSLYAGGGGGAGVEGVGEGSRRKAKSEKKGQLSGGWGRQGGAGLGRKAKLSCPETILVLYSVLPKTE